MQLTPMDQSNLSAFRELLAELKASQPPASIQTTLRLSELDLEAVYARDPELVLDLILRVTADCIVACYDFTGSARTEYRHPLHLITCKLRVLAAREGANSELSAYLSKLEDQLLEFGD